ncbi:MAG: ABC transporter substrate-binding protein [Myxococcales bacterium]
MASIDTLWFTRCPVPTATGLAYRLGWLEEEFKPDGIRVKTLQEVGGDLARHHYDHQLPTLVREGGNLLALPARAQGAPTRLVGLTWIDEAQSIIVRPDSDLRTPGQLKGRRLALPAFRQEDLAANTRGRSIARGMSLAGYHGALRSVGLTLDDVKLVEVHDAEEPSRGLGRQRAGSNWFGAFDALERGEVEGLYVKGAAAAETALQRGLHVGIDLDQLPERRFRVNNGTPRPITVHEELLENHFELLVRFLTQTLRAAEWAKENLEGVRNVLEGETRANSAGVEAAYRASFHLALAPDLSSERVELFRQQKDFQLVHGFLDRDFDYDGWIDRRPLEEAQRRLAAASGNSVAA